MIKKFLAGLIVSCCAAALCASAALAEPAFRIGIATPTVSQSEDAYRGAERIIAEYGDASDGGMIKHVTFPDNFMQEMETTISQIVGLADDPKVKVVVVNDAVPGTTEAFRRIKEKRSDVICLSGSPHEDPNVISSISDFSAVGDSISRGYLIVHTAKELGAKNFVMISFPRHQSYELQARKRAIMEAACKDLGLKFSFETAPDPVSDVGVAGAQQFILEKVPAWLEKYGKATAFYCTNDAQTEPLLRQIAKHGGLFIEQDDPSPILGYPGAFGIDLKKESGNWPAIMKKIEKTVIGAGGGGRMGTWSASVPWSMSCAMVEYGKRIVENKAKLGNVKDFVGCFEKYTPGVKWHGKRYLDLGTGVRNRKYIMLYQDTYIFGKGFMHTTDIQIPDKYERITSAQISK